MPVTNYHTVNGRLIGETTAGVRTDYLTDALGSITATVNQSAQIVNTYRYKPFGERLAKTGSGADPRFQFTGDTGSVTTARRYAENYNRRRSLDVKNGRWGSVDPIWPAERAYCYVRSRVTTQLDPDGLKIRLDKSCRRGYETPPGKPRQHWHDVMDALNAICKDTTKAVDTDKCLDAYCPSNAPGNRDCFSDFCQGKFDITVKCGGCTKPGLCAETSGTVITICDRSLYSTDSLPAPTCTPLRCVLAHELLHACGFVHPGDTKHHITPREDCLCFNCIRSLDRTCDRFYVDPGGHRLGFDECDKACMGRAK